MISLMGIGPHLAMLSTTTLSGEVWRRALVRCSVLQYAMPPQADLAYRTLFY